jgi:sugar phosphate isomerase/epimerase
LGPGEQFGPDSGTTNGGRRANVHIKDLQRNHYGWKYVLTGEGDFPLLALKNAIAQSRFDRFLSFEWEKKWHPKIADPEIALPHVARWFRENCP